MNDGRVRKHSVWFVRLEIGCHRVLSSSGDKSNDVRTRNLISHCSIEICACFRRWFPPHDVSFLVYPIPTDQLVRSNMLADPALSTWNGEQAENWTNVAAITSKLKSITRMKLRFVCSRNSSINVIIQLLPAHAVSSVSIRRASIRYGNWT